MVKESIHTTTEMSEPTIPTVFTLKNSIWIHIITWGGYMLLSTLIFTEVTAMKNLIFKNVISALLYAIPVYVNIYYFLPRYFMKGQYVKYYSIISLLVVLIVPIIAYLQYLILSSTDSTLYYEYFSIAHYSSILITATMIIIISTSVGHTFNAIRTTQLQRELKNYKLEAELKFLKTQVNPHFLFNSLNNIYSLAVTESKDAAPAILKLSDMMRYMLYESRGNKVPLDKEIGYLRSYIELQKLKTANEQQIQFTIEGNVTGVMIEPMLFIPFFENSFKHGNVIDTDQGWLKSILRLEKNKLHFYIANSVTHEKRNKDAVGGIGLENVRKRLDLLYPKGKHEMHIELLPDSFTVDLKLQLS